TRTAIHGLTFNKSMLRTSEQMSGEKREAPARDQADAAMDALARSKAGARRTAWIIGAIAAAFFIASLVQGHLVHIPS
ncbi:MAG: hypothetical protein ACREPZ_07470, partial [Rhodanobacteraceae bacterium]